MMDASHLDSGLLPTSDAHVLIDGHHPTAGAIADNAASKRVAKACLTCRKGKNRCEGAENPPCKRCRLAGIDCVFDKSPRPGPSDTLQERVNVLERTVHTLASTVVGFNGKLGALLDHHGVQRPASPPPLSTPEEAPTMSSQGISVNVDPVLEHVGHKRPAPIDDPLSDLARAALRAPKRHHYDDHEARILALNFTNAFKYGEPDEFIWDNMVHRSPLAAKCLLAAAVFAIPHPKSDHRELAYSALMDAVQMVSGHDDSGSNVDVPSFGLA